MDEIARDESLEVLVIAHKRIYALEMQVSALEHVVDAVRMVAAPIGLLGDKLRLLRTALDALDRMAALSDVADAARAVVATAVGRGGKEVHVLADAFDVLDGASGELPSADRDV